MKHGAYIFLACVIVFALFVRTATFSYIGLDDAAYTFRNPFVASGLSVSNVVEAFSNFRHGGIWMPVTYISYMVDASFCRMTGIPLIGWMHFVNVILHVLNFLLLWKLLCVLCGSPEGKALPQSTPSASLPRQLSTIVAALAAMIWAIHPLRVEPVAWIAARKELLWSLFALCGLVCWIGWCAQRSSLNRRLTTIFCLLACLSKPTAMCFPLLAALVEWRGRRVDASVLGKAMGLRSQALRYMPLVTIAAATAAIAAYSQTHIAGQGATALYAASFAHRLVNALSAIGFYLRSAVWPVGLHVDCRAIPSLWPIGAAWDFLALAVAVMATAGIIVVGRHRHSTADSSQLPTAIIFSASWFLLSLLPTLGLFGSFGIEAHADRFAYLPTMAFSFILLIPLSSAAGRNRSSSLILPLAIILSLSVVTFRQLSYWRDDATAHGRALACDPQHPRAMVHVADSLCSRRHDFDGGISLYRKALSLSGTVPEGGFNVPDVQARLAYALASRGLPGDFQEIKRLGAKVLSDFRNDRRGMMLDALGTAFMYDGDLKRAALLFKASIEAPDRFWPKAPTIRKLQRCKSM